MDILDINKLEAYGILNNIKLNYIQSNFPTGIDNKLNIIKELLKIKITPNTQGNKKQDFGRKNRGAVKRGGQSSKTMVFFI